LLLARRCSFSGSPRPCSSSATRLTIKEPVAGIVVDRARVFIVALILVTAIVVNVVINVRFNEISDTFPFFGAAVWVTLLVCVPLR
jgi:hypothetical protein